MLVVMSLIAVVAQIHHLLEFVHTNYTLDLVAGRDVAQEPEVRVAMRGDHRSRPPQAQCPAGHHVGQPVVPQEDPAQPHRHDEDGADHERRQHLHEERVDRPLSFKSEADVLAAVFAGLSHRTEAVAFGDSRSAATVIRRFSGLERSRKVVMKLSALFALDSFGGTVLLVEDEDAVRSFAARARPAPGIRPGAAGSRS